ncbi:hypothetical protein CRG98_030874 [Punica granatum]|uniref:Uncharacterized protein n=1 Tax=Punica granatum TaxID=22663 RepID=A0A2I0IYA6_PUNGR|nr:hypothetical protein CRG98_030874 [Punica granatum]
MSSSDKKIEREGEGEEEKSIYCLGGLRRVHVHVSGVHLRRLSSRVSHGEKLSERIQCCLGHPSGASQQMEEEEIFGFPIGYFYSPDPTQMHLLIGAPFGFKNFFF